MKNTKKIIIGLLANDCPLQIVIIEKLANIDYSKTYEKFKSYQNGCFRNAIDSFTKSAPCCQHDGDSSIRYNQYLW